MKQEKLSLMKKKTKLQILISILVLCMYLNIENNVSLMLSGIQQAFPSASLIQVQQVYSLIFLIETFTNFIVGWFASKLSKRKIIMLFQGGTVLGGLIAYFFGKSIAILYVSSVIIGFSAAIISTISKAIVMENFDESETPKVFALQQISQSLGTMMLQVWGGYMVAKQWNNGYLTFLFGLVSLFAAVFMLPEGPVEHEAKENGVKEKLWTKYLVHDVAITGLFLMVFMTYNSNLSFLVAEKGFGGSAVTGYLAATLTAFNFVAALLLPKTIKLLCKWIFLASGLCLIVGFSIIMLAPSAFWVLIGAMITGFAQGTFTPSVFVHLSKHITPDTNTASNAMVQAAGNVGLYIYPYVITAPSTLIGSGVSARFAVAIILLCVICVGEFVFMKKQKDF